MATRLRTLTLVAALIVASAAGVGAQPDRGAFVRVDATGCNAAARRASGFVWNATSTVVTSLHVVAGCGTISVYYSVQGGQVRKARIDRILQAADLALLVVEEPLPVTPLRAASGVPGPSAALTAWGYPANVQRLIDTQFRRRETVGTLSQLLTTALRQEVQRVGMPDLNTDVLLLDNGSLLPGHSGAPLVDASGSVAAIADGGLERGAAQVSWAIPATRLADLARSTQRAFTGAGASVAELFSAELVPVDTPTVTPTRPAAPDRPRPVAAVASYQCGGATFVFARTRTLAQLRAGADDAQGLNQLVGGASGLVSENDRFDLYQELRSGATVVLPSGARVSALPGDGTCVAEVGTGLQMLFHAAAAPTPRDAQNARVAFEQRMTARLGGGWQIDPRWTYAAPVTRFDGLNATRRASFQYAPNGMVVRTAFETLVTKAGLFMVVTNLRSGFTPDMLVTEQQCMGFRAPGCEMPLAMARSIALANLATHLSTFPIN